MSKKPGRNAPCPCGSGKKYKNCCADADRPAPGARPDELLFPNMEHDELWEAHVFEDFKKAGLDRELAYAHVKTKGLLVTSTNQHLFSAEDLAEWDAAIQEHRRRVAAGEKEPLP